MANNEFWITFSDQSGGEVATKSYMTVRRSSIEYSITVVAGEKES